MTFNGFFCGGAGVCVISEKNILQTDFDQKKNLARRYLSYNGFACQGKKLLSPEVWGKKILTQTKSPIPRYKVKWWAPYLNYFETRPLINRVFNSL